MTSITYQIQFFTFWHAGSGLSGGAYVDQLVKKDRNNLPVIPGKTLKGLLRDAACKINYFASDLVTDDFIQEVFGEVPTQQKLNTEESTVEGTSFFSNAQLSANLQSSIISQPDDNKLDSYLYRVLASTKISSKGLAEDHTLRQLEVTVPLTLYAEIEHFPNKRRYREQLAYCMAGVKRMGLNRTRGLGRCTFSMINE